ncbi:glutathione S-transferase N-terminal domain-containing protein [Methylobacterium sp. J-030]|uniref:glutathione S-transferase family protein n=1 Tax=Methylobacterium sp. J-030 TaxID=2836627 RepID=UPI001FB896AD|nr:glutathione S-transferase N-terminal domain-containing protein [Methylobacterium sp. J-030]MCJ2072423.1 glutathione S-transferase N-terminal domain-containing protein [Methylobacterium sp. J-030]
MTPNGYKVTILLEELGLPYRAVPVHIGKGEQFTPDFLRISPNGKIPAIVDTDGPGGAPLALFESGAILIYLADKAGGPLLPADPRRRYDVLQWLMFQMGGIGPMLGQAHHFRRYAPEPIPYAVDRYTREATRLYGVLEERLGETEYLAGDYSIADIAVFPWIRPYRWQGQDLVDYPNIRRWYDAIKARPAVERGLAVLSERLERNKRKPEGEAWNTLFGQGGKRPPADDPQNRSVGASDDA